MEIIGEIGINITGNLVVIKIKAKHQARIQQWVMYLSHVIPYDIRGEIEAY